MSIDSEAEIGGFRSPLDASVVSALVRGALFPAAIWSGSQTRFTWMNEAFRSLLQTRRMDVLGLPSTGFLGDEVPATLLLDAAYTGAPHVIPDYERLDDETGPQYWHLVFLPTLQGIGPYDVLIVAREVTDSVVTRRTRERERELMLGSLSLIGTTILTTTDPEDMLQRAVVEAVEAFDADWGWVAERSGRGWSIRNTHGVSGLPEAARFAEDAGSLPRLAAASGKVVSAMRGQQSGREVISLLDRHSLDAFLLVPVFERGIVTAVLGFCWGSPFAITEDHLRVAEQLAVSLSLALGNAHSFEQERKLGRQLTEAFFPMPAAIPGLAMGHLYRSASAGLRVGGDFFDVVDVGDGRVGLFIGDVAGHGMDAVPLAGSMKGLMHAELALHSTPAAAVRRANELVSREAATGAYASAFIGMLEPEARRLRYCSAGHPSPVILRRGGAAELLPQRQLVLGVDERAAYAEARVQINEGDLLVMYTDGLTDARHANGETFGTQRLLDAVERAATLPAEDVPEALFMEAFSFAHGELQDDIALLALRLLAA